MTPRLDHLGQGRHPLVTVDGLGDEPARVVALAAALAPFPPDRQSLYPGVRREIRPEDKDANDYATRLLEALAPLIAGAYDAMRFDLLSASFSIVTTPAAALLAVQRAPHFDSTDPDHVAILHYLSLPARTATAFFRHRRTGIERVDEANVDAFVAQARIDAARAPHGYLQGASDAFEEIGRVEAKPGRIAFYQGSLLHSGIIPHAMPLDPDPARGRLTANLFIRLRREI